MAIELRVVQFWSEIILVLSNPTRAALLTDFKITRMISDQTALHSVQLPLLILSPEIRHLLSAVIINGYNILKVLTFVKSSCFEYWLLRT